MQNNNAQNPLAWTEDDDRMLSQYVSMGKAIQDGTYHNREDDFALPEPPQAAPQEQPEGFWNSKPVRAVGGALDETVGAASHGIARGMENIVQTAHDAYVGISNAGVKATNWVLDKMGFFDDYYRLDPIISGFDAEGLFGSKTTTPQTAVGSLIAGAAQFGTGFSLTGAAGKAVGALTKGAGALLGSQAGPLVKAAGVMGREMATDVVAFAPDDRLADQLAEQFPGLAEVIPDFLLSAPDDTAMEGRLKNALEGVFVGGAVDTLLSGVRALKRLRNADVKLPAPEAKKLRTDLENAADSASKAVRESTDDIKPKPEAPTVGATSGRPLTASQRHDVDLETFVREYTRLVKEDAPLSDFKGLKSIRNNLNTADDVHRVFDALEKEGVFRRDPKATNRVTNKETIDAAYESLARMNAIGITKDELVDVITKTGGELGDQLAEAPAKIVILNDLTLDTVQNLGASLKTGNIMDVDNALDKAIGLVYQYDRVQTGAGRTLQIFDPLSNRTSKILEFFGVNREAARMIGPEETSRVIREKLATMTPQQKSALAARLSTVKDIPSMAQAIRLNSRSGKFAIMHNEVWINLILSGMRTQTSNVMSNMYMTAVRQPLAKMVGAPANAIRNKGWTADDTKTFKEGLHTWQGMYETMVDSFRVAREAFKLGENILKPGASVLEDNSRAIRAEAFGADPASVVGGWIDKFGEILRLPSRCLMAGDEFSSQLTYRTGERARARAQAEELYRLSPKGKGSKDAYVKKFVEESYNKSLFDKVFDDGTRIKNAVGIMDDGLIEAMEATFTSPLDARGIGRDIQQMANKHPMIRRFFAPFVRTPLNIVKDAVIDSTPLALLTDAYRDALSRGPREAAIARGRVALGSMTYFTAGMMALNGTITGGGPKDAKQRDMLMKTGWKPYSVKVGDSYVSYKNVEPIATILGLAADGMEVWSAADPDSETSEKAGQLLSSLPFTLYNAVSSKTFMRTMSDTFAMLHDPNEARSWLEGQALSYNPAFLRQLSTVLDPSLREAQTFLEKLKASTPGLSETLPQKYSWLTGEALTVYGGSTAGISPIVSEYSPDDPVADELLKYSELWMDEGGIKWADSYTVRSTKMDAAQRSDWDRLQGTVKLEGLTMHQALEKLFNSRDYDKSEPIDRNPKTDEKFLMIDKVIKKYRNAAQVELFKLYPELRDIAEQSKRNDQLKKNATTTLKQQKTRQSSRAAEMLDRIADFR